MTDEIAYAEGETYLVMKAVPGRYGPRGSMTLQSFTTRKTKPAVDSDEIAVKLSIRLPAALFVRPTLAASIGIEGDVPTIDLSPDTVTTIEDIIKTETDLDIEIRVVPPDE